MSTESITINGKTYVSLELLTQMKIWFRTLKQVGSLKQVALGDMPSYWVPFDASSAPPTFTYNTVLAAPYTADLLVSGDTNTSFIHYMMHHKNRGAYIIDAEGLAKWVGKDDG